MVLFPESTSTWSLPGMSSAVTEDSFTVAPVSCWKASTSCWTPAFSSSASETLNVIEVPPRSPSPFSVVSGPPHAVITRTTAAISPPTARNLPFITPPLLSPDSLLSTLHCPGQGTGAEVSLQEVHDEQDRERQDRRDRGHFLLPSPVDRLEHLKRQRVLRGGEKTRVQEL